MERTEAHHVYLLIHPEMWTSSDPDATHALLHDLTCSQVDQAYGNAVASASARVDLRVVVDDGTVADDIADFGTAELAGVVTLQAWEILPAAPAQVDRVVSDWARTLPAGSDITVAGFNLYDCVTRVVCALQDMALTVHLDEPGTLPCTDTSARALRALAT